MTEIELTELVQAIGEAMGFEDKDNGFFRANKKALNGVRYFGFISKGNNTEEDNGTENTELGRYWDLSLVFFPEVEGVADKSKRKDKEQKENGEEKGDKKHLKDDGEGEVKSFLVSLGVGTNGFAFDQDLASRPGTRRKYLKLHTEEEKDYQFFKNDFTDITTNLVKEVKKKDVKPNIDGQYSSLLQAGQYVELPDSNKNQDKQDLGKNQIIEVINNVINELTEKINNSKTGEEAKKNAESTKSKWEGIKTIIDKHDAYLISTIGKWIATYAQMRDWGTNDQKEIRNKLLPQPEVKNLNDGEIFKILKRDRFIVLQGAPGTGKTWSANEVAKKFEEGNVFFEQFHAETTYSDFIWGIQPNLKGYRLAYKEKKGVLLEAIKQAKSLEEDYKKNKDGNSNNGEKEPNAVLLIIDEINRANLSNVLGPVFYLFEKGASNRTHKIKIGNEEIDKLPENLFVIATMNTADRSLAVVDFALRRRFTWLTLKPNVIGTHQKQEINKVEIKYKNENGKEKKKIKYFMKSYFNEMDEIFEKYATDEELNLQPGQSYFIVDSSSDDEMKERLRYELMPLIKEYLNEGYLASAKEVFCNYFYQTIGELMYE